MRLALSSRNPKEFEMVMAYAVGKPKDEIDLNISDWRDQLRARGVDPDAVYSDLFKKFIAVKAEETQNKNGQ
jgi:hypothetical protein